MTDWFDAEFGGFQIHVDGQTSGSVGNRRGVVASRSWWDLTAYCDACVC